MYNGIEDGSSYADCVRLLGAEGKSLGQGAMSAGALSADGTPVPTTVDMYVWHNPAIPATLTLSFRDGKLTAREASSGRAATGGMGGSR